MRLSLQVSGTEQRYFPWGDKLVKPSGLRLAPGNFLVAGPETFGACGFQHGTDRKEVTILWP